MKKMLAFAAGALLIAGCASDRYQGGAYGDDRNYSTGYGSDDWRTSTIRAQTNGPGMHSPTATGLPGPGTTGADKRWDGGTTP